MDNLRKFYTGCIDNSNFSNEIKNGFKKNYAMHLSKHVPKSEWTTKETKIVQEITISKLIEN